MPPGTNSARLLYLFYQEIFRRSFFQPIPTRATATASDDRLQCKCGEFSAGLWPASVSPATGREGDRGVRMRRLLIAAALLPIHGQPAEALVLWNWSYSGNGVSASGTFTTNDAPDGVGFYQIVGITGTDNGVTIIGLQPTSTSIPGNEPYAVDNLVSAAEPHLTTHGFGFSLANGNYANPFYNGSSYYEYLSVPPYVNGAGPERPVTFSAAIVPEPSAASHLLAGLVGLFSVAGIFRAGRTSTETRYASQPCVRQNLQRRLAVDHY
jgi:hypothetical protein